MSNGMQHFVVVKFALFVRSLRPRNQFPVRVENQAQTVDIASCADRLANANSYSRVSSEGTATDANAHAATGAACDPFGNRFAIREFGLFVGRPHVGNRLIIGVATDAAVPINSLGRATGKQPSKDGDDPAKRPYGSEVTVCFHTNRIAGW